MSDLCRREGIKPHSYYSWTKEFMEAGREKLTRESVRDATRHERPARCSKSAGTPRSVRRWAKARFLKSSCLFIWSDFAKEPQAHTFG